jgi:hypothetical protein
MQGAIKFHNRPQAMPEVFAQELLFTLANSNDIEQVVTDNNLYFQKLWIYPASAVGATGKLTANGAAVQVGKSGPAFSFTPDALTFAGSVAQVRKAAHGLAEGASIKVTGATPGAYNKAVARIFNVTTDTFEYQLASQPTGPATVLPTIARVQFCPDTLNPSDLPIKFELPLGQKMRLSQVIITGAAGDGVYLQWS